MKQLRPNFLIRSKNTSSGFKTQSLFPHNHVLIISNKEERYQIKYGSEFKDMLDPRDRVLQHTFQFKIEFSSEQIKQEGFIKSGLYPNIILHIHDFLKESLSNVASAAFKSYANDQLKQNEAKQYASKNMMVNIQSVFKATTKAILQHQNLINCLQIFKEKQKQSGSSKIQQTQSKEAPTHEYSVKEQITNSLKSRMAVQCDFMVAKILKNIAPLYPQAAATGGTERMGQLIHDINRTQDLQNDFIFAKKINPKQKSKQQVESKIKNKRPDDYSQFIMNVLNTAIKVAQQRKNNKGRTMMELFTQFNQKIFWFSHEPIQTEKSLKNMQKFQKQKQNIIKFFDLTLGGKEQQMDQQTVQQTLAKQKNKQEEQEANTKKEEENTKKQEEGMTKKEDKVQQKNIQNIQEVKQKKVEVKKYNKQNIKNKFTNPGDKNFKQFLDESQKGISYIKMNKNFGLNQKIPNYVKSFTIQQIQSKKIGKKHSSILRILTTPNDN